MKADRHPSETEEMVLPAPGTLAYLRKCFCSAPKRCLTSDRSYNVSGLTLSTNRHHFSLCNGPQQCCPQLMAWEGAGYGMLSPDQVLHCYFHFCFLKTLALGALEGSKVWSPASALWFTREVCNVMKTYQKALNAEECQYFAIENV